MPTSETRPMLAKSLHGIAWVMGLAPAFHHGPRPLTLDFQAQWASRPSARSRDSRVRGRFHCRQAITCKRCQITVGDNTLLPWHSRRPARGSLLHRRQHWESQLNWQEP